MSLAGEKKIIAAWNMAHSMGTRFYSDFRENAAAFKEAIFVSAKESKLFEAKDQISVETMGAKLKDETTAVLIMMSEEKKTGYGTELYHFKQHVLQRMKDRGIALDSKDIRVEFRNRQEMDELISKTKGQQAISKNSMQGAAFSHIRDGVGKEPGEFNYEEKARQFVPTEPLYNFDRVILPKDVIEKIQHAVAVLECERKVFQEWGLYEIQPNPSTSLSFFGPSGTGKTMAAEAVAQKLGKKILKVSYADVESKYHGEGPKMVKAIFLAAQKAGAVLFFDEADSLLSKRLTNVSQGSEQAINSMRSQLLISLEEFRGIVIFATNLVINYDKAFLTRLISVEFPIPDAETRAKIWNVHLKPAEDGKKHKLNIPLASDVDVRELAEKYDFVGREIRNAVVGACVKAAMEGKEQLSQTDFINVCDGIVKEREALKRAKDHTIHNPDGQDALKAALLNKIKKEKAFES